MVTISVSSETTRSRRNRDKRAGFEWDKTDETNQVGELENMPSVL